MENQPKNTGENVNREQFSTASNLPPRGADELAVTSTENLTNPENKYDDVYNRIMPTFVEMFKRAVAEANNDTTSNQNVNNTEADPLHIKYRTFEEAESGKYDILDDDLVDYFLDNPEIGQYESYYKMILSPEDKSRDTVTYEDLYKTADFIGSYLRVNLDGVKDPVENRELADLIRDYRERLTGMSSKQDLIFWRNHYITEEEKERIDEVNEVSAGIDTLNGWLNDKNHYTYTDPTSDYSLRRRKEMTEELKELKQRYSQFTPEMLEEYRKYQEAGEAQKLTPPKFNGNEEIMSWAESNYPGLKSNILFQGRSFIGAESNAEMDGLGSDGTNRIYLNPDVHARSDIFRRILESADESNLPLTLKMLNPQRVRKDGNVRTDGIVVYVGDKERDQVLSMILNIAEESADAFEGRATPKAAFSIGDGIALGKGHASLNETIATMCEAVGKEVKNRGVAGQEARDLFRKMFRSAAERFNIDPDNPALSIDKMKVQ